MADIVNVIGEFDPQKIFEALAEIASDRCGQKIEVVSVRKKSDAEMKSDKRSKAV